MKRTIPTSRVARTRRAFTTPLIAFALLAGLGGVALVLDRLWLDATKLELTTAAEAAAIAAARQLASDEQLQSQPNTAEILAAARLAAVNIAAKNFVAGRSVFLNTNSGGDIRFGKLVTNSQSQQVRFLQTEIGSTTVVVTAARSRARNNPVALVLGGATRPWVGDVVVRAEATVDNRVVGVRPAKNLRVPAFPIAILHRDASGLRSDTWEVQIEQRAGSDRYAYDQQTGKVRQQSDGIPEIVLKSAGTNSNSMTTNVVVVDLNTDLQERALSKQIALGWSQDDLGKYGGAITTSQFPLQMTAGTFISGSTTGALAEMIGVCRIVLLSTRPVTTGQMGFGSVNVTGFVAGRIMSVSESFNESVEIVLQPCVLTTRTAILSSVFPPNENQTATRNRYIYKLHLTY